MTFAEGIKWLPGTDGCRVLVEEQVRSEHEEMVRADLGFRDSQDGGLMFRFEFFDRDVRVYYTSEVYYKPDGETLTEFSLTLLDKMFPEGTWPRRRPGRVSSRLPRGSVTRLHLRTAG